MADAVNGTDAIKLEVAGKEEDDVPGISRERLSRQACGDYDADDDDDDDDEELSSSDDDDDEAFTDYTAKDVRRLERENLELRGTVTVCTEELETCHRDIAKKNSAIARKKKALGQSETRLAAAHVKLKKQSNSRKRTQTKIRDFLACILKHSSSGLQTTFVKEWAKADNQ